MLNHEELINTITQDLNGAIKCLFNGQYIAFCDAIRSIAQRLALLNDGVKRDIQSRDNTINELKERLRSMGCEVVEVTAKEYAEEMKERENGK